MRIIPLIFSALAALPTYAQTESTTPGIDAIHALGRINGISLACNQAALVDRARQLMVRHAPKTRQNGAHFEDATHHSFLEFTNKNSACPSAVELVAQIDQAGVVLKDSFSVTR